MTAQPALDLGASSPDLAWDFPERSPGTLRHPAYVPLAEQRQELAAELDRRRRFYPRPVERRTMTAETMEHELTVFAAMVDDYDRSPRPPRPATSAPRTRLRAPGREPGLPTALPRWRAEPLPWLRRPALACRADVGRVRPVRNRDPARRCCGPADGAAVHCHPQRDGGEVSEDAERCLAVPEPSSAMTAKPS